jgi:hypothetical protein
MPTNLTDEDRAAGGARTYSRSDYADYLRKGNMDATIKEIQHANPNQHWRSGRRDAAFTFNIKGIHKWQEYFQKI